MKYVGVVVWQDTIDKTLASHVFFFNAENEATAWEIVEREAAQQAADRPWAYNFNTNLREVPT